MINYKLLCCAAVVIGLAVAINAHTGGHKVESAMPYKSVTYKNIFINYKYFLQYIYTKILAAGTRHLLQQNEEQSDASAAWDEAKNTVADTFAKFWGGSCVADSQCADPVAHCSSTESK